MADLDTDAALHRLRRTDLLAIRGRIIDRMRAVHDGRTVDAVDAPAYLAMLADYWDQVTAELDELDRAVGHDAHRHTGAEVVAGLAGR